MQLQVVSSCTTSNKISPVLATVSMTVCMLFTAKVIHRQTLINNQRRPIGLDCSVSGVPKTK